MEELTRIDACFRNTDGTLHTNKQSFQAVYPYDNPLRQSGCALTKRIETVACEDELDEAFEAERHLFYVACTRARDRLLISGVEPGSEFFEDFLDGR